MAIARARGRADVESRSGGACSQPWRGRARAAARSSRVFRRPRWKGGRPRVSMPHARATPHSQMSQALGPSRTAGGGVLPTTMALWNFMVNKMNQKKCAIALWKKYGSIFLTKKNESPHCGRNVRQGNTRKTNMYSTAPIFISFANYMR